MLPILMFDKGSLSPSYGYLFDRRWLCPQETILGIAWKFARMNRLPGHIVVRQLASQEIDPYEGIPATTGNVAVSVLARTLAIPRRVLNEGLQQPDSHQRVHGLVRFCTQCMKLAYHGVMHQRAGATRCPCHQVALEEHCRGCGESMAYRLTAELLGAPFRCAKCRRPYAGWGARLQPHPAPPELRRAITRARYFG